MSNLREDHALREHDFIHNTGARLDEFLAQGQAVLDDLKDQGNVLKGTKRRLLDAANTLGLSRNVIGWIERRRFVGYMRSLPHHAHIPLQHTGHVHLYCWSYPHIRLFLLHLEVPGLRTDCPVLLIVLRWMFLLHSVCYLMCLYALRCIRYV